MKRFVAVIAALIVVAGLGTPAEAAPKKFKVGIRVSATTIDAGQNITIKGKVSPKAAGQKVALQKKFGGKKWKTQARTKIRRNGTYRFVDRPSTAKNRFYRVLKPKKGKLKAGHSKRVLVKVRTPTITITEWPKEVDAGGPVTVAGRTSAGLRGTYVYLKMSDNGDWRTLGSRARVDASGNFRFSRVLGYPDYERSSIRVWTPRTNTHPYVISPPRSTLVYYWGSLDETRHGGRTDAVHGWKWDAGSFTVNGAEHHDSLHTSMPANETWWDLRDRCTHLRGDFAIADGSASTGASRTMEVLADGKVVASFDDLQAGAAVRHLDLSLRGVHELRWRWTGEGDATIGFVKNALRCLDW